MRKKLILRLTCKYCGAVYGSLTEQNKNLAVGDFLIHVIQGHEMDVDELIRHIKEANYAVVEYKETET